jgi:AcrR family transcriptional regulator
MDWSSNSVTACLGAPSAARSTVAHEQRARIVSAAEQLICEGGAGRVTLGNVCSTAGVSRSAFHAVFEDEAQCLMVVFEEASSQACSAMTAAYRAAGCWVDAIRGALADLLAFLDQRPRMARFLIVDSLASDATTRARRENLLAWLARALEADRPPLPTASLPAPFGGQAVVGAVASILHGRLLEEPTPSLLDLHGSLMGLIVLPYLDVAAARNELSRSAPEG